jgi:KAP-like P-loop domain-containing protein
MRKRRATRFDVALRNYRETGHPRAMADTPRNEGPRDPSGKTGTGVSSDASATGSVGADADAGGAIIDRLPPLPYTSYPDSVPAAPRHPDLQSSQTFAPPVPLRFGAGAQPAGSSPAGGMVAPLSPTGPAAPGPGSPAAGRASNRPVRQVPPAAAAPNAGPPVADLRGAPHALEESFVPPPAPVEQSFVPPSSAPEDFPGVRHVVEESFVLPRPTLEQSFVPPSPAPEDFPGVRHVVEESFVPPRPTLEQSFVPPSPVAEELPRAPRVAEDGPSAPASTSGARIGPLPQALQGTAEGLSSASAVLTVLPSKARAESASDQPTKQDSIGFKPYVDALAQFLMNPQTAPPLTVSLEGEWGSGKSSFLSQLEDAVRAIAKRRQMKEPLIVPFNAWRHDTDQALWASFALEFERRAAPPTCGRTIWRRLSLAWKRRGGLRSILVALTLAAAALVLVLVLAVLIKGVFFPELSPEPPSGLAWWIDYVLQKGPKVLKSTFAALLLSAMAWIWPAWKAASNLDVLKYPAPLNHRERLSFLERFQDDFAILAKTYSDERRTFVFVDDLDRCEVPKATELLQALNMMLAGDVPIFVVLAMDRQKIAAGIASRHKDVLRFLSPTTRPRGNEQSNGEDVDAHGIAFGYEFVEKFVQLPLRVPHLTEHGLSHFLDSLLNDRPTSPPAPAARVADPEDIVKSDSEQVRRVMEMVAPTFGFNPRRLKQFLNLFRFRHYVAMNTQQLTSGDKIGWTLPQLGKVVAIELRWPLLLDRLLQDPNNIDVLCRLEPYNKSEVPERLKAWSEDEALRKLLNFSRKDDLQAYKMNVTTSYLLWLLYGAGPIERS